MTEPKAAGRATLDEGGDPACWLGQVCPECGKFTEQVAPKKCPHCGAELPTE